MRKKHRSKNTYIKHRPMLLNSWSDFHTLGIFAAKTNTIEFARKNLSLLRSDTEEHKLFRKGIADAPQFGFEAIAYDVYQLRELTGERFDQFIYSQAGFRVLTELKEAIRDTQDWEPEEMKQGCKEVTEAMIENRASTEVQQNEAMA